MNSLINLCVSYRNEIILPRLKDKFKIVHDELKSMLPDLLKILDKYNIKNFITSGTLLGYKRNKKIIPWDDDIDIAIIDEDNIKQKFENIKIDLENKYYISDCSFGYKFNLKENKNVFIDLFIYKQNGDKFLLNKIAKRTWPNNFYFNEDIFPIRQDDFENIIVNIPNNSERYLIRAYGKNYDIPKLTHIHNNDINIFDKSIIMLIQKIPLPS